MPSYDAPPRDVRLVLNELFPNSSFPALATLDDRMPKLADAGRYERAELTPAVQMPLGRRSSTPVRALDLGARLSVQSLWRGLRGQCPHCGQTKLLYRYLKVEPVCQLCGHDLERYPADDGPACFTALLVAQLVIVPFLILAAPLIWKAPLAILAPSALAGAGALALAALPIVKGGTIGALYALDINRQDAHLHTADEPCPPRRLLLRTAESAQAEWNYARGR